MLKNYLMVAIRNVVRHKVYSLINLIGLAVGMACTILLLLWVQDEWRYDRFHEKADRIYRVLWDARFGDNGWTIPLGPFPVGEALETHFPEVERTVRLRRELRTVRQGSEYVVEKDFFYVENGFFEVFTVPFLAGNPKTALRVPNSVVLTERSAQRYFPDGSAIGQTLELNEGTVLSITGVVKGFPPQSHFHFDFLAPLETLPIVEQRRQQWSSATVYTYLVLREGASVFELEAKLRAHVEGLPQNRDYSRSGDYSRFLLQPLTDIHLRSHYGTELEPNVEIMHVYVFSAIAVFILLLACINFVNLATARSANRAREVGIRKVLGSYRTQLVRQFLVESTMYVALAVVLALGLSELGLPLLNGLAGKQLTTGSLSSLSSVMTLAGIAVLVALLAGMYPAFYLSSFWPVQVLKGRVTGRPGRDWLRNGLVVAQFTISIGLLFGTLVVRSQLHYMQNKKLGFDKAHALVVHGARVLGRQAATCREQLGALPQVVAASLTRSMPGHGFDSMTFKPEQPANYEESSLTYAMVDEHYVEALGLKIVAGRDFSPEDFASGATAFLLNQAAVKALGWTEPVGKRLTRGQFMRGPVVGVVEDFRYGRGKVDPLVIPLLRRRLPLFIAVRLHPGNVAEAIAGVQEIWKRFAPNQPFAYSFLDEDYGRLYHGEQRMAQVFGVFSCLGMFIACLGLFGLAAFTAEQRTKEIGIRKVLGASVAGLVLMLTGEFTRWVMVANLIAWPVAYVVMDGWLQDFAYRIAIGWWPFVMAGVAALSVSLLTVGYQAIRAATANPVDALRYE